ncbi:luciferin 4-monooxygenase-like isoform X2 [Anthonomus grandis grandis]|uniref:luciferin 4-monooxygenase-like isoform X2 n=1 Tax=Anthonomus grandis grandis TaxID=2921223 RepID=UPI00216541CE|nr:luciferin 4-monooxygenase-like isoform X2 [Anthonomus grandis grandis]
MAPPRSGSLKSNSLKSRSSSHRSTNRSSGYGGSADIYGSKFLITLNYGGLGYRMFEQLSTESDKVLQVDAANNITETKGSIKIRSTRLAIEMKSRGVGKGDIIIISSKTHAHQTIVLIAALFIGAIICPIPPEFSFKECLEIMKKIKPKMCFCDSRTVSQIERILQTLKMTSEVVNFGNQIAGTTHFSKLFPFREDTNFQPYFIENVEKEVAFVMPTQGTTGEPKLVCVSHHNIFLQMFNLMEIFDNPSKVISFLPLSWITQTILACTSIEYGVTRIMTTCFNERGACKMIHDFVIDHAVLGTELALRLIENVAVKDYNLACLKCILVGVVNTSLEDMMLMRKTLPNVKFLQSYVVTEAGIISGVPASEYEIALQKPTSVGRLLKNSRIKILDTETHLPLGPNETGELYFYGDGIMLGYFKDNTRTMTSLEKGYFKTGDLAKYDDIGWIYLEGRIEDIIYFDKIIPKPLEESFVSHPYVYDAVVIGNSMELIACIEKKPDNRVLTSNHLMAYFARKQPNYHRLITSVIFFNEFPRTDAGTIKKRLLREQLLKVKLEYTTSLASITTFNASSSAWEGSTSLKSAVSIKQSLTETKDEIKKKN